MRFYFSKFIAPFFVSNTKHLNLNEIRNKQGFYTTLNVGFETEI
jgi:hypothetical protein